MFIFDYLRAFLVFNTKNWPFLGINMVFTLYLDKEKELCLDVCLKALVIRFSKIYKSIQKTKSKNRPFLNFFFTHILYES